MKRITRDFFTLYNKFWYRDFPLAENHKMQGSRAEWTTHIGICVRSSADLMGYFTHFEQGNRTDAVIRDNVGNDIAHIEWEWYQPLHEKFNEVKKLYSTRKDASFSVLITYSKIGEHERNLRIIRRQWKNAVEPLVVIVVTFELGGTKRKFDLMETYHVQNGVMKKVRSQPALPWNVRGSRWEGVG
ncbi:MAG: hypothetical protein CMN84_02150 [Spongiibacteraceae bacterium]|jgi:hypothetical protein|nr:hypothetical protein [Spongiibacteraceae bacterium]|tara:strand:- start:106 stop:663 length:558 start_codon:yes stop_codon:yes gene_type:complete